MRDDGDTFPDPSMAQCLNCAMEVQQDALFCANCGSTVASSKDSEESAITVPVGAHAGSELRHDLEGIAGWLILVAIGLALSPLLVVRTIVSVNLPFLTADRNNPFLQSHPGLVGLIGFELITNLVFIALLLALNWLFYCKKKSFPTFMICFYVLQIVVHISIHVVFVRLVPDAESNLVETIRPVFAAVVWVPYLLLSRRVKATFVH